MPTGRSGANPAPRDPRMSYYGPSLEAYNFVAVPSGRENHLPSFGEKLRLEREKRAITLEQISLSTKIGMRMLQALEEENSISCRAAFSTKALFAPMPSMWDSTKTRRSPTTWKRPEKAPPPSRCRDGAEIAPPEPREPIPSRQLLGVCSQLPCYW